jgi:hypothetical protein
MRNLLDIIDQIIEVAPDLKDEFASLKKSVAYSAPELMGHRWRQAASILNKSAADHPKQNEIAKIFAGAEQITGTKNEMLK